MDFFYFVLRESHPFSKKGDWWAGGNSQILKITKNVFLATLLH